MNHRAKDPLQRRSAQGSGHRERFRWLVGATILFVLSSVGILHGGMKILWGAVPNRSDAISTTDQAFAARFRQRLEDETKVRLSGLTDFAWDTVCLIEPFDLDEASLREALHAGGLPDRSVRLPNGPKPIPQPNWLFAFLERGTVVHTVEFHHRELEPRHGAYCVPEERATFEKVRQLASEMWIDLARR